VDKIRAIAADRYESDGLRDKASEVLRVLGAE